MKRWNCNERGCEFAQESVEANFDEHEEGLPTPLCVVCANPLAIVDHDSDDDGAEDDDPEAARTDPDSRPSAPARRRRR